MAPCSSRNRVFARLKDGSQDGVHISHRQTKLHQVHASGHQTRAVHVVDEDQVDARELTLYHSSAWLQAVTNADSIDRQNCTSSSSPKIAEVSEDESFKTFADRDLELRKRHCHPLQKPADAMKRKVEHQSDVVPSQKVTKKIKATPRPVSHHDSFRVGLFDDAILKSYTKDYAESQPYKHAVIRSLMNDSLLRSVRSEVREHVHFSPKETDIYKIHQSGDLANLDGLDNSALSKLPSLLKLRDALYSVDFREYVAAITRSGPLSGRKTDMAINVYTPGCHLLCHDDVIGSRRVSYILYLTDPDAPWKEDWGGALRLYPTEETTAEDGVTSKTPSAHFSKVIPPAWNQLSFFAVQPGESFHDVEEVYHASHKKEPEEDGGRVRMAISGWFHIPQVDEDGYVEGLEEKLADKSSLMQLQGKTDQYDLPVAQLETVEEVQSEEEEQSLNAEDIEFLLKFMAPTYLTPDTMEQVNDHFGEQSSITLDGLLSKKYAARLRKYVESQEVMKVDDSADAWNVARPPHKHRYLYIQPAGSPKSSPVTKASEPSPIRELLEVLLPSHPFRKWLEIATGCQIENFGLLARRFRRGLDYALATSHVGDARLELSLALTPTPGWAGSGDDVEDDEAKSEGSRPKANTGSREDSAELEEGKDDVGGHEVYMAGDDADDGDAAVYKSSIEAEDDNVLFTVPASWNKLSIVLRDSGVLRFMKYVSQAAKGDRWDIQGIFGIKDEDDAEESGIVTKAMPDAGAELLDSQVSLESSEGEEFNGFAESSDDDSDD